MSWRRGRLLITVLIALAVAFGPALAQAARPKVALLPFLVHAKEEDKARLGEEIRKLLLPAVITSAMEVIPETRVAELDFTPSLDPARARKAGGELGADFVIYGSLTKLGKRISLDARVLEMAQGTPRPFFHRGPDESALPEILTRFARDAKGEILALKKISEVVIRGNKRIEAEAISVLMKTKADQFADPDQLDRDLKSIYGLGYFSDVKAISEPDGEMERVIIQVKENPALRDIEIEGGTLDKKDVEEAFNVPTLTVFNGQAVANGLQRVADLYRAAGYLNVEVGYELGEVKEGLTTLTLKVDPKNRLYIKEIKFVGNKQVKRGILLKQMETSDWGIFSFITDSGVLKREVLDKDVEKIRAYYRNHGFLKAQVGDPEIEISEKDILVTVNIEEGDQYKLGQVVITGDMIKPEEELKKGLSQKEGMIYSRSAIDKDRQVLVEAYASKGYAKVRVQVKPDIDAETKLVGLTYEVTKNDLIYFERIQIHGNTRTRDKVIRREMRVKEGDLVDLVALRRSAFNLRRLQFFEEVEFNNLPGSAKDKMVLDVRVKEKPTGLFNFGVGYSTSDSAMIMMQIQEQNFLGRGQELTAAGTLGIRGQRFSVSFTEPYLFDKNLSLTTSVYNVQREYIDYDKSAYGGSLGLGFPFLFDYTRVSLKYTIEEVQISEVNDPDSLLAEEEGWHSTSMISLNLRRDSRDLIFGTTKGSENFIKVDFAGLGGSNAFTKVVVGSSWFVPFPLKTTFHIQGKLGYVRENSWGHLPIYEKFFLGGINTLRGFEFASVSPVDDVGNRIGGEKMLQFNAELIFPLIPAAGVKGVVFFDAGNVWGSDDNYDVSDLKQSVGVGIRWYSPIGPLRLEYGHVVRGDDRDGDGGWEFTIGSVF